MLLYNITDNTTMNTHDFSSLPLSEPMLTNLKELGFNAMTHVQAESLPHVLKHKDVIVQAKTGSGKTVAFGIGILNKLQVKKFRVQSLILCPTRELADQVAKELRRLARTIHNIKILTLCGGQAFGPQLGSLEHQAHIIVGTPGRILKHLNKGSLSLVNLEMLVLDEADRMLDMGFIDDMNEIISHAPKSRQTLLFSATYPEEIKTLSAKIQKNAINIKTDSKESANKITEYFYKVAANKKLMTLFDILGHYKPENVIIFSNTKLQAHDIAEYLRKKNIEALAIHGDLEQYQRNDVLIQFANKSCSVLVATDVAARGLDIKELSMVINYDLPHDTTIYTHRIGRTARAGATGLACTLYTEQNAHKVNEYKDNVRLFEDTKTLIADEKFSITAANRTLVIQAGKKDKMRPGDILGALSGEVAIAGDQVGKIDVYDRQSYVAINRNLIDKVCEQLNDIKIKGRKCSVWILK